MIEKIIQKVGDFCSWLSFALVILITFDVFLRYVFNFSSASLYELEWHFFAIIFLFISISGETPSGGEIATVLVKSKSSPFFIVKFKSFNA